MDSPSHSTLILLYVVGGAVCVGMTGGIWWLLQATARASLERWADREGFDLTFVKRGGFFTSPFVLGVFGAHTYRVFVCNREGAILKAWVRVSSLLKDRMEVRWDETE